MKVMVALSLILFSTVSAAGVLGVRDTQRLALNAAGEVEVCWLGGGSAKSLDTRKKVEDFLVAQLTLKAGVILKFLPDCFKEPNPFFPVGVAFFDAPDNSEGLKNEMLSTVDDKSIAGHPMAFSKGSRSNLNFVDLILTQHFQQVSPNLEDQARNLSPQGAENLILSIALHEFMHVLGFNHEQSRPDSPCNEGTEKFNSLTSKVLTPYDELSIMNYCHTHHYDFEAGTIELSELDVVAIKILMRTAP